MENKKEKINIDKKFCTFILQHLAKKYYLEIVLKRKSRPQTIIEMDNQSYIIDKKYEKLAKSLIHYYKNRKLYHIVIPAASYLMIQSMFLTPQVDFNPVEISLDAEEEMSIEENKKEKKIADTIDINEIAEKNKKEETSLEYAQKMNDLYEGKKEEIMLDKYNIYLEQYSNYFDLDSKKVISMAQQLTNYYDSSFTKTLTDYALNTYNIEDEINNPEAASILFVYFVYRDINNIPRQKEISFNIADFGYTKEDLITTDEIETIDFEEEDNLDFYKKRRQYIGKIADLLNMDKSLTLAISYAEAGFDGNESDALKNGNNYGGMKYKSGDLMKFPKPNAGMIAHDINAKKYTKKTLEKTWEKYAEKGENWLNNVQYFYKLINDNYEDFFPETPNTIYYKSTFHYAKDNVDGNQYEQISISYKTNTITSKNIETNLIGISSMLEKYDMTYQELLEYVQSIPEYNQALQSLLTLNPNFTTDKIIAILQGTDTPLRKNLYIGDSRMQGMLLSGVINEENSVYGVGYGYNWFIGKGEFSSSKTNALNGAINGLQAKMLENESYNIVIWLGVNDCTYVNANTYFETYKKLASNDWSNHNIYIVSIGPVKDNDAISVKNTEINSFNRSLKELIANSGLNNLNYIDLNLNENSIHNYDVAGLHYGSSDYQNIFNKITETTTNEDANNINSLLSIFYSALNAYGKTFNDYYANEMFLKNDTSDWNQNDLSYHVDDTFTFNSEEEFILMRNI